LRFENHEAAMSIRRERVAADLKTFALGLPGAYEATPWGESVVRVKKGIFVFLGRSDEEKALASEKKREHIGEPGSFSITVKLPHSGPETMASGIGRPSDYGLGAKGWVTLTFPPGRSLPTADLWRWIEESYRAVAPPTLVKQLGPEPATAAKRAK
jgi:predicted DNA-binding protein (MmcQ/YjbR family)